MNEENVRKCYIEACLASPDAAIRAAGAGLVEESEVFKYADDSDYRVRAVVAQRSADPDLLRKMYHAEEERGTSWRDRVFCRLAANPAVPEDVMVALSKSTSTLVQEHLAQNPAITVPVQVALATSTASHVRLALTENPSASSALLRIIAESDPLFEVREAAELALQEKGGADEQVR